MCGAVAGAVGAVGAAWATSRTQWKSAKLAARAEHLRQRRESRASSYRKFIDAHWKFAALTEPFHYAHAPRRDLFELQTTKKLQEAWEELRVAFLDVSLAGPQEVARVADEQRQHTYVFLVRHNDLLFSYGGAEGYDESGIGGFWESMQNALAGITISQFLEAAPIALDNDGSKE